MISIIIPTFNRRRLLARAVASVQAQTFQDWELIIVDDGSEDDTQAWLARLTDPRIRPFRQVNAGVSHARNRGIQASRHPWIAFLDSDDQWLPGKLQTQIEHLERFPEYRACHTDEIWIRHGVRVNPRRIHSKRGGWVYPHSVRLCSISPSSILLQRRLLDQIGHFDPNFPVCEDYELWLRLTAHYPILLVPEAQVVKYGGHADQLSRSRWGFDRYRVSALIKTYQSQNLTWQQRNWTRQEICRKSYILANGYAKRGKESAARYYRQLAQRWESTQAHMGLL